MKRILIISYEFPPVVGGAGSVARDLAIGLSKEAEVHLLTEWISSEETEKRKMEGYVLHEVRSKRGIRPLNYWNYIKGMDLDSFHRIIINDARASMVAALFFSEKLMERTVVYIHGREPEEVIVNPGRVRKLMRYPQKYERFLKRSRRIVSVSNYMKEKIMATGIDIESSKIEVIYNGIEEREFNLRESRLREAHKISHDKTILLSVSRIVREKGYGEMAEIFKEVCERDNNFHWVVAGSGGYLEVLRNKIEEWKLGDKVTFLGGVPREKLPEVYSGGDLYWLLSNFDEALGLTYLEARFCGTPALARNKSGERETIEEGITGHLADSDEDAIEYILGREYLELKGVDKAVEGYRLADSIKKMKEVLGI
jgi:glycosyltransferase involved in cell wall biosynthesis